MSFLKKEDREGTIFLLVAISVFINASVYTIYSFFVWYIFEKAFQVTSIFYFE